MSDQILINYEAVYTKCRELRRRLQTEVRDMDGEYRQIQSSLQGMDSRTNAQMMETIGANQGNIQVTAETLVRLLATMESAAQAVEQEELQIKQIFSMDRLNRMPNTDIAASNVSNAQNPIASLNNSNDIPSTRPANGGNN
ncbi:MAG: hypothetical protein FWG38_11760 [Defluviitaleaceae bacterium]|nr:hypothetical protein [Defluviitaleaceae bacterium]